MYIVKRFSLPLSPQNEYVLKYIVDEGYAAWGEMSGGFARFKTLKEANITIEKIKQYSKTHVGYQYYCFICKL